MQLRLKPRYDRSSSIRGAVIKAALVIIIFAVGIFLLDKIQFPVPSKLIKQEISNDKLITIK